MSDAPMSDASMSDAQGLELADVTSGYGGASVIQGVSLHVGRGEILALLGKNGMGKTTLLKTIFGLVPARGGRMNWAGARLDGLSPAARAARGLGYAPQEQPLFPDMTIRDNLRLALPGDKRLGEALERVFGYFPFLRERLAQRAGTLSGGEQKMLILARALMVRPRMLLIDEISEGLQPSVVERILGALKEARDRDGVTLLIVEQNLDFALRVADRWAVLKLGRIDDEGLSGPDARSLVLQHLSL